MLRSYRLTVGRGGAGINVANKAGTVVVTSVQCGSEANMKSVYPNSIIRAVNQIPVSSIREYRELLQGRSEVMVDMQGPPEEYPESLMVRYMLLITPTGKIKVTMVVTRHELTLYVGRHEIYKQVCIKDLEEVTSILANDSSIIVLRLQGAGQGSEVLLSEDADERNPPGGSVDVPEYVNNLMFVGARSGSGGGISVAASSSRSTPRSVRSNGRHTPQTTQPSLHPTLNPSIVPSMQYRTPSTQHSMVQHGVQTSTQPVNPSSAHSSHSTQSTHSNNHRRVSINSHNTAPVHANAYQNQTIMARSESLASTETEGVSVHSAIDDDLPQVTAFDLGPEYNAVKPLIKKNGGAILHFAALCEKLPHATDTRMLLVSRDALYVWLGNGKASRCVPLSAVTEVLTTRDNIIGFRVHKDHDHDILLRLHDGSVKQLVNILGQVNPALPIRDLGKADEDVIRGKMWLRKSNGWTMRSNMLVPFTYRNDIDAFTLRFNSESPEARAPVRTYPQVDIPPAAMVMGTRRNNAPMQPPGPPAFHVPDVREVSPKRAGRGADAVRDAEVEELRSQVQQLTQQIEGVNAEVKKLRIQKPIGMTDLEAKMGALELTVDTKVARETNELQHRLAALEEYVYSMQGSMLSPPAPRTAAGAYKRGTPERQRGGSIGICNNTKVMYMRVPPARREHTYSESLYP